MINTEVSMLRGVSKLVRVFENDLSGQQMNLETNCFIASPSVLTLTQLVITAHYSLTTDVLTNNVFCPIADWLSS